jgi:kumamolisin
MKTDGFISKTGSFLSKYRVSTVANPLPNPYLYPENSSLPPLSPRPPFFNSKLFFMPTSKKSGQTGLPDNYVLLANSEHLHPEEHQQLEATAPGEQITATLILRRQPGGEPMKDLDYYQKTARANIKHISHKDFAGVHGASPADLDKVTKFVAAQGLQVVEASAAKRSVVVRGTAAQLNKAFAIELHHYRSPLGDYHGHEGHAALPAEIAGIVELIVGLDNRPVPAKHFATNYATTTASAKVTADPPNTVSLTPQQVAKLYNFPAGTGAGQTIGIYEMPTSEGNPGYAMADIQATMKAFGGNLTVPTPVAVSVDGQQNSGVTDGETLLDITVSSAIAQGATIAVYFTAGASTQNIIHCLQRMVHPDAGDPVPTVISISYGWSADNMTDSISAAEYQQMSQVFQDAAHLGITTLISSGDSGVEFESTTEAEASYPATDPWVIACGGTTIGNVNEAAATFTEYLWNDSWGEGQNKQSGATGGGVSELWPVVAYQNGFPVPVSLAEKKSGRGIPDVAGNASPLSGYPQVQGGQQGAGGGTSAVAPLYAGLIALINANLGAPVGFINAQLYALASTAFRELSGPPGPANNSFGGITGYPATKVWNACTGLGSINGQALQDGLKATAAKSPDDIKNQQHA